MGRLRLFGELIEAGGAIEGGGGAGGGHQVVRAVRTAGDYQTTSTSFVDIDTANLAANLTTGESWVLTMSVRVNCPAPFPAASTAVNSKPHRFCPVFWIVTVRV